MTENKDKRSVNAVLIGKMAKNKWLAAIQAVIIALCTWVLWYSDAYFMPYLLVSVAALVCLFFNLKKGICYSRYETVITFVFSLLYALMITIANYKLWDTGGAAGIAKFVLLLFGTFVAFANILFFIAGRKSVRGHGTLVMENWKLFLFVFLLIAVVNSAILFFCKYPGFLTLDSVLQVRQVLEGHYNNSHPFYHTMMVKLFVDLGLAVFGNMNAAVAVYMVFQICFMALCFAFAVTTMKEAGCPRWSLIVLVAFFLMMPYHIVYSFTLWKDVVFGGVVLLYTVFLYRMLKPVGHTCLNAVGLIVSGLGFCLLRNNGLIAFVGITVLFLIIFKLQQKKLLVMATAVIFVSFVMKHPVLKALNVAQPDLMESLSIPIQQVALDVIENDDFTEEEVNLISQVVDMERIPETYEWYIADPMKNLIRESQNQQAISEHKTDYLGMYLSRICKHPWTYVRAWIDQTKGYWNSGYPYWIWCLYADGEDIGIHSKVNSSALDSLFNHGLSHFLKSKLLKPLISIGLFVWCIMLCLYVAIIRKDKVLALITIPSLMVIVTLLMATPVFSEFRYAYLVFCTMPVIGIMAYIGNMNQNNKING